MSIAMKMLETERKRFENVAFLALVALHRLLAFRPQLKLKEKAIIALYLKQTLILLSTWLDE